MIEKKHICITVTGGIGDEICAEPIIRWMVENFCKNDEVVIVTRHPEMFTHLPVKVFDKKVEFDREYLCIETQPRDHLLNFHRMHPVDFISILLLRRTLPIKDKSIKVKYPQECIEQIKGMCGGEDLKKSVVLHPGISWESKTIPKEFWQKVIKTLEPHAKIILIGKEKTDYEANCHYTGVLDFSLNEKHYDLRNKINLSQLFCLLDAAPILITNDSAPLHIAGAFDNYIGLIPTCKHPDYLLPFRNRNQGYKTKVLWKKDVSTYYDFDPIKWKDASLEERKFEWEEMLPSMDSILKLMQEAFSNRNN